MKRNPEAMCENCPYWGEDPDQPKMGLCRRRSPTTSENSIMADFPVTVKGHWCGEHPDFEMKEPAK